MGENKKSKINFKAIFSSKRNIYIVIVVLIIICVGGFAYLRCDNNRYQTGQGLTDKQKRQNIEDLVKKEDYEGAKILVENYYYYDENKENLRDYSFNIKICKEKKLKSFDEAENFRIKSVFNSKTSIPIVNDETKPPAIEKFDIVPQNDRNTWLELQVTITNPNKNKTIDYIEIGFDFFDSNKNLVDTDWTNDTNIQPNSKRIITKSIKNNDKGLTIAPKVIKYTSN
ncbi:hypothetical protein FDB15_05785 [Clostridium botulinum]|uniref:FxLYD domain-containing protein n=1 Tax=unclassified Clostridium TaxID=2614128 RepID=UPI0005002AC3|nr:MULTISPECIES: FxLYD domain-containing protein [unclassified Clostridium]KFX54003.1 hypothetical protein KU40_18845 [Clostridium botulinum]MBY6779805.1 hypothetical protein [Clostridium botulinum]MBY6853001.1 hypothetical protein [Clostridium botulinum]MBY7007384.1 hypothetical protein [Clostridium botulinum]NFH71735.1 hypothetical protein [Clostridium botulinum]